MPDTVESQFVSSINWAGLWWAENWMLNVIKTSTLTRKPSEPEKTGESTSCMRCRRYFYINTQDLIEIYSEQEENSSAWNPTDSRMELTWLDSMNCKLCSLLNATPIVIYWVGIRRKPELASARSHSLIFCDGNRALSHESWNRRHAAVEWECDSLMCIRVRGSNSDNLNQPHEFNNPS